MGQRSLTAADVDIVDPTAVTFTYPMTQMFQRDSMAGHSATVYTEQATKSKR